ncbi:MAG: UvrD-helicase domain-containing protein, partial [Candidatus Dojkabacteria bacterium]|nr:UvrD-helicase domain-containing protein [Candidatus Dojkabacteria bacterium]
MKAQTVKESQRTRVEPVSVLPDISYSYDFLNSAQRKAVMHRGGPLLIIAGAGTGKTSVITNRILWLIQQGLARPEQILALTFTNKAAQEMEERVDVIMPYGYTEMWISTFHAFCDQVLKQDAIHIGLDPGFILMALAQEYVFFRSHLFEMSLDRFRPHGNPTKFIGEILRHFSRLGDEDIAPDEYLEYVKKNTDLSDEQRADFLELATVYGQYSRMKEQESRFGFYDLVPQVLRLFRRRPLVLKRWQEKFKYVLVDEFQDTNYAQNELVEMLVGEGGRITVVGDDDQSIYKFRGAAISNILDFKKTYPKYSSVVLTQNYRSHTGILDTAYRLIKNNDPYRLEVTEKVDKRLVSVRDGDIPPSTYKKKAGTSSQQEELPLSSMETGVSNGQPSTSEDRTPGIPADKTVRRIHERTDVAEAEAVAKEIERLVSKEGYCYRDIALLVRAHDHSEEFMQSFRYHGIPFSLLGPKGLYSRPEIKNLIAFLRILTDYCDDASLYRVLMIKKILTPREFIDLQHLARKRRISMFELCEELTGVKPGV